MDSLLRLPQVLEMVGVGRSTLFKLTKQGRFPRAVRISQRCVGWRASEVAEWILDRQASRTRGSTPTPSLLAVAMHEAGHAVAALSHCRAVQEVWVDLSNKHCVGRAVYRPRVLSSRLLERLQSSDEDVVWLDVMADAIETLAGPIAEIRWRRTSESGLHIVGHAYRDQLDTSGFGAPDLPPDGMLTDFQCVELHLRWAFGDDAGEMFSVAWTHAIDVVLALWPTIEKLGRALAQKGRLGKDEILAVAGLGADATRH